MKREASSTIRTLIFDLDGTLIDSSQSILECYQFALRMHNITPAIPLTSAIIGPTLKETLIKLTGSKNQRLIESLAESFKSNYDSCGYRLTQIFPEVSELLLQLFQSGRSLYIATNKRLYPTTLILDHLGWTHYFQSIIAIDSIKHHFIDKCSMLGHIVKIFNIKTMQTVYIGDRIEDGIAADANHLRFIAAKWGYNNFIKNQSPTSWIDADVPSDIWRLL